MLLGVYRVVQAPLVLKSMLPIMPNKVLMYARNELHMQINVASILWVCGFKGYSNHGVGPVVRAAVVGASKHLLPAKLVTQSVGKGQEFRTAWGSSCYTRCMGLHAVVR